jgi:hypothetical protein
MDTSWFLFTASSGQAEIAHCTADAEKCDFVAERREIWLPIVTVQNRPDEVVAPSFDSAQLSDALQFAYSALAVERDLFPTKNLPEASFRHSAARDGGI